MKNIRFLYILPVLLLALFSCKPKENMVYMEHQRESAEQQAAIERARYAGLLIDAGDLLEINVNAFDEIAVQSFNLTTMSRTGEQEAGTRTTFQGSEYSVNTDGEINFPVLGKIYVKGMTKQQLTDHLQNRLKQYLTEPYVTVKHKNFNISVLGEVKSPGQHTSSTEKLNLFQALALAGDMTTAGDRTAVKLIRSSDAGDEVITLDVTDKNIVNSPYYYLQQNDILYVVPDKASQVAANNDPNRNLYFQIFGAALAVATLIITLSR